MKDAVETEQQISGNWRVISMTGRSPVRVDQRVWPTIAHHTWLVMRGVEMDGTEYEQRRVRHPDLSAVENTPEALGPSKAMYYTASVRKGPTGWLVYGTQQDIIQRLFCGRIE